MIFIHQKEYLALSQTLSAFAKQATSKALCNRSIQVFLCTYLGNIGLTREDFSFT